MDYRYIMLITATTALIYSIVCNPVEKEVVMVNSPAKLRYNENILDSNNAVERRQRVEKIKHYILLKLGLTTPPTGHFSKSDIPTAVLSGIMETGENRHREIEHKEEYIRTEIIIVGKLDKYHLCGRKQCLRVRIKNNPSNSTIESARLWIHIRTRQITKNSLINLYKVEGERKRLLQRSRSHSLKPGWYAMELQLRNIVQTTSTGQKYVDLVLEIQCKRCFISSNKSYFPFLKITTRTKIEKRKRRAVKNECTSSSACCRAELVINFKDIGWDKWVLAPKSYNAYYCNGNCANNDTYHYQHTGILKAVAQRFRREDIKFCCSPKSYSSLIILYTNDGNLIRRVIENMIVDECWCT